MLDLGTSARLIAVYIELGSKLGNQLQNFNKALPIVR
jgi:hypothetical protein